MKTSSFLFLVFLISIITADNSKGQFADYNDNIYKEFTPTDPPDRWQNKYRHPRGNPVKVKNEIQVYRKKIEKNKIKSMKVFKTTYNPELKQDTLQVITLYDRNGYLIDSTSACDTLNKFPNGRILDSYYINKLPKDTVFDTPGRLFCYKYKNGRLTESWESFHDAGPAFQIHYIKNRFTGEKLEETIHYIDYYANCVSDNANLAVIYKPRTDSMVLKYTYVVNGGLKSVSSNYTQYFWQDKYECTYNPSGDLIEELLISANDSRTDSSKNGYRYDNNRNIILFTFAEAYSHEKFEYAFRYSESGLLLEESIKSISGKDKYPKHSTRYKYNKKNRLITAENYYTFNEPGLASTEKYEYDNEGNLILLTSVGSADDSNFTMSFTYDNKGNILSKRFRTADTLLNFDIKYVYEFYE